VGIAGLDRGAVVSFRSILGKTFFIMRSVNLRDTQQKPIIDYPCKWTYKIIGSEQTQLESAARAVVGSESFELTFSNRSKAGTYLSYNLSVTVRDDEERLEYYEKLRLREEVKMVL